MNIKKFIKNHLFFLIFLFLNIVIFFFGDNILTNPESNSMVMKICFAPIFLADLLMRVICPQTASGVPIYDACSNLPTWLGASVSLVYVLILIGSIGFLTFVGLVIDVILVKYKKKNG